MTAARRVKEDKRHNRNFFRRRLKMDSDAVTPPFLFSRVDPDPTQSTQPTENSENSTQPNPTQLMECMTTHVGSDRAICWHSFLDRTNPLPIFSLVYNDARDLVHQCQLVRSIYWIYDTFMPKTHAPETGTENWYQKTGTILVPVFRTR